MSIIQTFWQQLRSGPCERQALAVLRIATGVVFLLGGWQKLNDAAFPGQMAALLRGWMEHHPFEFYQNFIQQAVLPNADLFAALVTYGELFAGGALLLGLFTPPGALIGTFLAANFFLASQHTDPGAQVITAAFCVICLALFWGKAGQYAGLDPVFFKSESTEKPKKTGKPKAPKKVTAKKADNGKKPVANGKPPKSAGKAKTSKTKPF